MVSTNEKYCKSMELKDCFREKFLVWLSESNNPKMKPYVTRFMNSTSINESPKINEVVKESLGEILDILLREPEADYFWYGHPEHGGELSYSLPHHDVVPGNALRVDKEKIKIFLRDYKINQLIN
jgi:hypothetical protein